ncbi:PREDICTED: mucin-like protein [Acropora digitifera]|uniref:mucin-like protein n=1 Tax=Acropora digitifera TaxID=70779 RepID=UPI00077A350E|nr:PREDICTED: mucin-like protein [Acropora digitifera]
MRIENSNGFEDSDFYCLIWYHEEPDPDSFNDSPDPCPCTVFQAAADNRYTWVEPLFPYTDCFYTIRSVSGRGRRCCYYKDDQRTGALIFNSQPKAGTIDNYHRLRFPEKHQKYDVEGFAYCCLTSKRRVESCEKYYEKRPSEGCEAYIPPRRAPGFGDPHVITLDGRNYTFNGLGEYTMINVQDNFFQLQARTRLAKGGGTATVFSAAVAKEQNASIVQCNLKEEGGLEVLIDGQIFQEFYNLSNVSVILNDSVAVSRPRGNSFLVTYPSGISVTVTDIQGSLSIVFAAPLSFQGQTKGLLGTWNDDQEDDFLTPDGSILPSNATGRQVHFNFGLKWQLSDNTTLFTYKPGESTSTFTNASFIPIFLDEPIQFASDELRIAAELACQGDVNCMFDIASTGDLSVGESTKEVSVQLESEAQALENFPPKILVGPLEVNVTVNTSARITITAQDPNNDSLSFSVVGNLPTRHTTASNETAITLSWNVTTAQVKGGIAKQQ